MPDDLEVPSGATQVKYINGCRISAVFLSTNSPCIWGDSYSVVGGLARCYVPQRAGGKHLFYVSANLGNGKQVQLSISPWYAQSLPPIQQGALQLNQIAHYPSDLLTAVDAAKVLNTAVAWARTFGRDTPMPDGTEQRFGSGLMAFSFDLYDQSQHGAEHLLWPTYGNLADFFEGLSRRIPGINGQSWPSFNGRLQLRADDTRQWVNCGNLQLSYGIKFDDAMSASNGNFSASNNTLPAVPNSLVSGLKNGSATS